MIRTMSSAKASLATAILFAAGTGTSLAQSASVSIPMPPAAPPPAGTPAAPKPAPPAPSAFEDFAAKSKKPVDWFSWGADLRVRQEYFDTSLSLTSDDALAEQNLMRFRGRLWTTFTPMTDLTLNARLAAEPRYFLKDGFAGTYRSDHNNPREGMEWRYGILDNLNVKWNNMFGSPVSMSVGRQDLLFGDFWNWWLVADGTPGDGSWTYFLDSARATVDLKDIKTKIDAVYIYQNARPDEWIPTFDNSWNYGLTEQNEQGVILYASNKLLENTTVDAYFIYKRDDAEFANGDNADIFTLGARFAGYFADRFHYSVEGAYQFGEKQDPTVRTPVNVGADERDLSAFGGNAKLSYLFKDRLNNQAHVVFEYLSGDDPDTTGDDEMFDILWGRWPRWSELYIYSYARETSGKVAQLNNLMRVGAGWTTTPMKNMSLGAYYNALFAPEEVPTRTVAAARFSQDGNFRGHMAQAVLGYTCNKHVKYHVWAELVNQDDYYAQRDLMTFFRWEVSFTW